MWIVQLALRRPYTFVIMSMLIVILASSASSGLNSGITPEEMAEAITVRSEHGFTGSVNHIQHIESQSLPGLGIVIRNKSPALSVGMRITKASASLGISRNRVIVAAGSIGGSLATPRKSASVSRAVRRISLMTPSGVKPNILPTEAQTAAPRGKIRSWIVSKSTTSRGSRHP